MNYAADPELRDHHLHMDVLPGLLSPSHPTATLGCELSPRAAACGRCKAANREGRINILPCSRHGRSFRATARKCKSQTRDHHSLGAVACGGARCERGETSKSSHALILQLHPICGPTDAPRSNELILLLKVL
jgi:hypothetical protein